MAKDIPKHDAISSSLLMGKRYTATLSASLLACCFFLFFTTFISYAPPSLSLALATQELQLQAPPYAERNEPLAKVMDTETLKVSPLPFHEVTNLLEPLQQKDRELGFRLQIQPQRGCNAVYHRSDHLVIAITAQKPLRYVYVDYYQAAQDIVVHLFPNPRQPNNFIEDSQSLTLGHATSALQLQIAPPFGPELVTVIASDAQLFGRQRLFPERTTTYVLDLQRALTEQSGHQNLVAMSCFITTQDQ